MNGLTALALPFILLLIASLITSGVGPVIVKSVGYFPLMLGFIAPTVLWAMTITPQKAERYRPAYSLLGRTTRLLNCGAYLLFTVACALVVYEIRVR